MPNAVILDLGSSKILDPMESWIRWDPGSGGILDSVSLDVCTSLIAQNRNNDC